MKTIESALENWDIIFLKYVILFLFFLPLFVRVKRSKVNCFWKLKGWALANPFSFQKQFTFDRFSRLKQLFSNAFTSYRHSKHPSSCKFWKFSKIIFFARFFLLQKIFSFKNPQWYDRVRFAHWCKGENNLSTRSTIYRRLLLTKLFNFQGFCKMKHF